jgi:hypothetical protein
MSFLAWRELIEYGRSADPVGSPSLDVSLAERDDLLAHCHELLYQDEFRFWCFPPDEVQDLHRAYLDQAREADGRLDRRTLADLLCQGVRQVVTDRWRTSIRDRLRRMAPLLRDLYEEDEVWQWAIVAADALDADSTVPLEKHPFLLGMAACSLEDVLGRPVGWFDGE